MRKVLFIAAMLLVSVAGFCQTPHKVYCEIVGTGNVYNITGKVQIFLPAPYSTFEDDKTYLCDNKNKPIKFASMADAVSWMAKTGWQLDKTFSATESQGVIRLTAYHYILVKEISKDEQIIEGLKTKATENSQDQEIKETKQIERDPATYKDLDPKSSEYWELKEKYDAKKKAEKKNKFNEIYK